MPLVGHLTVITIQTSLSSRNMDTKNLSLSQLKKRFFNTSYNT